MRPILSILVIGLFSLTLSFVLSSCADDDISTDSSYSLSFSSNTISFDTVFTTISSTTAQFKVYNPHKEALRISSIKLLGGVSSAFRINVSGRSNSAQSFSDIELNANDSLYIFVNINKSTNNQDTPILIEDKIQFVTNGNLQEVTLRAVGQDVVILKNLQISNDTLLNNDKPYLIYGNLSIASGKTLEIEKGARLYFHDKSGLIVNGNLKAIGSLNEPIIFRGDRIDNLFDKLPYDSLDGQWNGINLSGENASYELEYVDIRSAKNGIIANDNNTTSELTIRNSRLHNFTKTAIYSSNLKLTISNTQISNCGDNCILIEGGEANFTHCTITNYFPVIDRNFVSVIIRNYDQNILNCPINNVSFNNCIVFGNYGDEILFQNNNTAAFNVNLNSCFLSGSASSDSKYTNCSWHSKTESIFVNTTSYPYNFQLTRTSLARDKADWIIANSLTSDKNGNNRIADQKPDFGAYEYIQQ